MTENGQKRRVDITGERFGQLVAIEPAAYTKDGSTWVFQCDCGTTVKKLRALVRKQAESASCGCASKQPTDLLGQKFGELAVLAFAGNRGGNRLWLCACECSNFATAFTSHLLSGHKKSCGGQHHRKWIGFSGPGVSPFVKDITGHKFGKLTALECVGRNSRGLSIWRFRCDCGREKAITPNNVTSGTTKSCGCIMGRHKLKDITGQRFGKLVVLYRADRPEVKGPSWMCKCDCGQYTAPRSDHLRRGVGSCGTCEKPKSYKHGYAYDSNKKRTPEHTTWSGMKQRCLNPNSASYPDYGGRGIRICESWLKFENFLKDMGPRPAGTSLDRIDVNKGYSPENCRWADMITQKNNVRKRVPHREILKMKNDYEEKIATLTRQLSNNEKSPTSEDGASASSKARRTRPDLRRTTVARKRNRDDINDLFDFAKSQQRGAP